MNVMSVNEQIPDGRYSKWCEKRPLACADKEILNKAQLNFNKNDLTSIEQNIMFVHDLVGINGIEFVLFSSAKFLQRVDLPENITIVPCFLPKLAGTSMNNPIARATNSMMMQSRYIYDGWIPIENWNVENVRNAINDINKTFSLFSLQERISNSWEPKYLVNKKNSSPSQKIEEEHIDEVKNIYSTINSWSEKDAWAFFRSMGWLSQSLTLPLSPSRFLLCVVAIESLANYIEYSTKKDSIYSSVKTMTHLDDNDRDECIEKIYNQYYKENKTKAVLISYSDCLRPSIKKMLVKHLNNIFLTNKDPINLLFSDKIEGKTLYDLRHLIAHGSFDSLSDYQKHMIQDRIWDIEDITRKYLVGVFNKITDHEPFTKQMIKTIIFPFTVGSKEEQWRGPKHMALLYINQI